MAGLNRICGDEFSTLGGIPPTGVVSRWNIAGCSAICQFRPECCSWVLVLLSPDCSRVNLSVCRYATCRRLLEGIHDTCSARSWLFYC